MPRFLNLFLIRRLFALHFSAVIFLFLITAASFAQAEAPDVVAIFNEAQNLHEKGDLAGAIKLYDKAVAIEPAFPEAHYQRGIAELALGKTSEAERSFRRAIELRPDWTLPLASLGSILVQKNSLAEAETILLKVIGLQPSSPPALTALTELRIKAKAPANILHGLLAQISVLTRKANPTASLWTAQAALENTLGRRDLAKSSLSNALEIDPKDKPALYLSADIAVFEGDVVGAKTLLNLLDDGSPATDPLKFLRAKVYVIDGKPEEALAQLKSIPVTTAGVTELLNRINASQTTSPVELEKLLAESENDPLILGRLCSVYRKDNPAKALIYCQRASAAEPANVHHAVGFGAALVQAKEYDTAVTVLRRIIEIAPDNSTAHANLATALFQLKRFPEAISEFRWLEKADPKSVGPYLFLGIIYDQLEQYLDALAYYQQYIKFADPVQNKLDIEKVNLRLPALQKLIKDGKGKKK